MILGKAMDKDNKKVYDLESSNGIFSINGKKSKQ
jgi:hypothetical protein